MSFDRDYHDRKEFSLLPEEKRNSTQVSQNGQDLSGRSTLGWRNSYSSGDVEEINTDHGLDETFAPNACRKGKKTVGQSQGNSSSCKNVEDKLGNRNEDVNSKDIVIEKIDKAEFRNKRMHFASEKGSSIRQQLRRDSAANLLILAV
ncbi:Uncharacterized protein Fot_56415 [Forsythia ovata]|uniref:Uncharacterized protein n=1 Tax=Forsythia ovata TaxID=205694 RepID=A0ABD1P023_9LAMI